MPFLPHIRRRLALALCRAAGLDQVAVARAELDELRAEARKLRASHDAMGTLLKTMAQQTNSNTLMLKRWLEASPALQTVERAAQEGRKRRVILPPTADIRVAR